MTQVAQENEKKDSHTLHHYIACFCAGVLWKTFFSYFDTLTVEKLAIVYSWWSLPTTLTVGFLYGFKNLFKNIGIDHGLGIGFVFAGFTVLPMLISSAIMGKLDENLSLVKFFHQTLGAGFFEEYLFRGFLFGLLFRKLNWGFIPASLIGGIIFGLAHIYQGSTPMESLGVFAVTSIGAVWFSWLYVEWNSLWVAIFLHAFMNLSWVLFDVSNNALGDLVSNLFRGATIALTIVITVFYHRKRGLIIQKRKLFVNNNL